MNSSDLVQKRDVYMQDAEALLSEANWNSEGAMNEVLFGDQCRPIRLVEAAVRTSDVSGVSELLDKLLAVPFATFVESTDVGDQCRNLAEGMLQTLKVACALAVKSRDFNSMRGWFATAAECFNAAWPNIEAKAEGKTELSNDEEFRELFNACGKQATGGKLVAWDLLQGVLGRRDDTTMRLARTPVLLAHDDRHADVAWLTLQLFKDHFSAFTPDVLHTGCLCLAAGDDEKRNLQHSMQRIWAQSGLAGEGWRARWSVTAYDPSQPLHYQCLEGRSLEAATLIALWSCRGGIPGDDSFFSPTGMLLDPQVAITARVEAGPELKSLPVANVDYVPAKLDAARHAKLDTVVLADDESESDIEKHLATERETYERQRAAGRHATAELLDYPGLFIKRVKTLGEALDLLLVTNRHLAGYQNEVRERWLCQWKFDDEGKATGKAEFDTQEWTEEMAAAAREKFSPRRIS